MRRGRDRVGGVGYAFAPVRGSCRHASGAHAAAELGLCGFGLSGARAAAGRRVQLLIALESNRLRASTARHVPDRCQCSCARCTSGALPERWLRIQQHHRVCTLVLVPRTCTVLCNCSLQHTFSKTVLLYTVLVLYFLCVCCTAYWADYWQQSIWPFCGGCRWARVSATTNDIGCASSRAEDACFEAAEWLALGARFIGGCCMTTPDEISRLKTCLISLIDKPDKPLSVWHPLWVSGYTSTIMLRVFKIWRDTT